MKIFTIGDIHGKLLDLKTLVAASMKYFNPETDYFLFLGDYIDRGPDSKGVVDFLLKFQSKYPNTVFLKGNHDDMFLSFLGIEGDFGDMFIFNGGGPTLDSYGIEEVEQIKVENFPADHIEFFKNTKLYHETDVATFVHAAVRPNFPIEKQDRFTLIWAEDNRDAFFSRIISRPWHKMLIHGHTKIPRDEVKAHMKYNRINVDTGCVYGGVLSCLVVDTEQEPKDWKIIQAYGYKVWEEI